MKTNILKKMQRFTLASVIVVGLVAISQQAFAQVSKTEKQKKEAVENSLKKESDAKKTIEAEKAKLGQESKVSQKDAPKDAQLREEKLREEKLRNEAEQNKRKEEAAKSEVLKNDKTRSLHAESESDDSKERFNSAEEAKKANVEAEASETVKRKAELEKLKKEGKLTEEEYKTALQRIEMKKKQENDKGQKPKLGTSDKR